jgi:hypothetical protein
MIAKEANPIQSFQISRLGFQQHCLGTVLITQEFQQASTPVMFRD